MPDFRQSLVTVASVERIVTRVQLSRVGKESRRDSAASCIASWAASAVLAFVPRGFVQWLISLPLLQAMQTAIPVGLPSILFGLEPWQKSVSVLSRWLSDTCLIAVASCLRASPCGISWNNCSRALCGGGLTRGSLW